MSLQPGRLKTQNAPVEDSEKCPTCAYSNATDEGLPMAPPKYTLQIQLVHLNTSRTCTCKFSSRTCKFLRARANFQK